MSKRRSGDELEAEDALFAAAMGTLGSAPPDVKAPVSSRQPALRPPSTEDAGRAAWLREQDALFEASLSDAVAPDPEDLGEAPPGPPRSVHAGTRRTLNRRLRQGDVRPDGALDLHGLKREAARTRLITFVRGAFASGGRLLLVVTGRGKHSAGDAVLREMTPHWVREDLGDVVQDWWKAPAELGGEGALLVLLRPPRRADPGLG